MKPSEVVDRLFVVFESRGHGKFGHTVTQLQHGLQTAAVAHAAGERDTFVAACLMHDYNHLIPNPNDECVVRGLDAHTDDHGLKALWECFPTDVIELVRSHVDALRYLCWKDAAYYAGLPELARQRLSLEGGPMSEAEARRFEAHPSFKAAVRLRRYDDIANVKGMHAPGLENYRPMLESLVKTASASRQSQPPSIFGGWRSALAATEKSVRTPA